MTTTARNVAWHPGEGTAVIGPAFALLADELSQSCQSRAWDLVQHADVSVHDVVSLLAADGLADLPDFAVVVHGAPDRVIVRGTAMVELSGTSEPVRWTAPQVSTWSEHLVPSDGGRLRIWLGGPGGPGGPGSTGPEGPGLPVSVAVLRASALVIQPVTSEVEAVDQRGSAASELVSTQLAVEQPTDAEEQLDMTVAGRSRRDLVRGRPSDGRDATARSRPAVRATVTISDGRVYEMDHSLFIGRSPEALGTSPDKLPQLVTVDSPQHDVSRTHATLRRDGEDVLVCDVSTNGTILLRPGRPPERLAPRTDTLLSDGCALELGDGIRVEVSISRGDER